MKISPHAKERMAEMGVDITEVLAAYRDPDLTYQSSSWHPGKRRFFARGRLAVVVDYGKPSVPKVITVLWHRAEGREAVHVRR